MSYTAAVLSAHSHNRLLQEFENDIPEGWTRIAHHMTINMGDPSKGPAADLVGNEVKMKVVGFGENNKVMAVEVESDCPSTNKIKHVTIAVNYANGGKPFQSNQLEFHKTNSFELEGVVQECP